MPVSGRKRSVKMAFVFQVADKSALTFGKSAFIRGALACGRLMNVRV